MSARHQPTPSAMTTFNIDSWVNGIKGAFISTLEESDVPMSYIDIAKKIGLKKHDVNNWFAMGIIGELFETGADKWKRKQSIAKPSTRSLAVSIPSPESPRHLLEDLKLI